MDATQQLDPDELRRNLAITLGTQQPQLANLREPQMAAPPSVQPMPNKYDLALPSAPQPKINAPRGTTQGDQAERSRLMASGSGISQISPKIQNSDFGQNHPVLGKVLGGLAQGAATVGDIGLSALGGGFGRLAATQIPGTAEHHNVLLHQANSAVAQDEENAGKEAQTAASQAEVPLRQAQTAEAQANTKTPEETQADIAYKNAQAANLLHPQAKTDFEAWQQQNPGKPIEEWLKAKSTHTERPDTPEQQFIDEFTKAHPNGSVADAVKAYAAATQKPERGPTIIQQNNEVDRIAGRLAKPYDDGYKQGNATLSRIQQTVHSVDSGYVGQGLAIPELLTALVSGQGTGVRITQPELNAITAARGIAGDAESFFNSMAGKGKLTSTDKAQIKAVLADAQKRLEEKTKIHSDALDAINGAESRSDVVKADKDARQKLNDLERTGHYSGQQVKLKNGQTVTVTAVHPDGSFDAN